MKDKKRETFIYEAFGFPVKLINVPMRKIVGEWIIDVEFGKLTHAILLCLIHKPAPLIGPEVRFIRKYLKLSTTAFGAIFGVTHAAVLKWENGKTSLPPLADVYIRLYVLDQLHVKDKEFRHLYHLVNPENLLENEEAKSIPLSVDFVANLKIA